MIGISLSYNMAFALKVHNRVRRSSITVIPSASVEPSVFGRIRKSIEDEFENNHHLYDAKDVQMYTKSDYIRRYMERQKGDEQKTTEMMLNMMKLRKKIQLSRANDLWIPCEIYRIGGLIIYNEDRDGNLVLYVRGKYHRKIPEAKPAFQYFVRYMMFKIDAIAAEKGEMYGYTAVFDMTGVKTSNYDLPELVFVIDFFAKYMPAGLKHVYLHNVPWYMKPFINTVFAFVPNEWKGIFKFTNRDDLFRYVEKSNVPKFLGGTCQQSHKEVPQGCRSFKELAKEQIDVYKVSEDKIEKMMQIYEKIMEEE